MTADELTWAPAWRIRELIGAKEVSPVEVAEHFLARIEEFDPTLRAFANVVPEQVRQQAKAAEAAVLSGVELGPLHGVPTAVKHHIDIAGARRAGPPFWFGTARRDDLTVERLRAAGAVIVGHNTMPVMTTDGAFDWDVLARNPWDTDRVAGASSAGGGAAVAAGLVPFALGSDGGGSSRLPPAYNGVIGMHPTGGLVPWADHRPWAVRLGTTIGPIARDVRDVATVLSVIAGPDGGDHMGLPMALPDPRGELEDGADGLRLAWTDDFGFASTYAVEESPRVVRAIREAAFALTGLGATVEETVEQWEDYLPALNTHRRIFTDMPILGPEAGAGIPEDEWEAATELRRRTWNRFARLFADHDLLLCPTVQSVAPTFGTWRHWWSGPPSEALGMDGWTVHTAQFNWLRFPAVAVACGFVDGMPVSLQIVGPPGSDARVLRLAHAYRQAFPQDQRPPLS